MYENINSDLRNPKEHFDMLAREHHSATWIHQDIQRILHPDVQKIRLWHARINSSPVLAWVSDSTVWYVNVCQSM